MYLDVTPIYSLHFFNETFTGAYGATFTFVNRCEYPVWPGILANAVSPSLKNTGFVIPEQTSRSFQAPAGWSARYWGRIGCKFDESGSGSCSTRDCGSGQVECNGVAAAAPATLTKLTHGTSGQDFYTLMFCPSNPRYVVCTFYKCFP